jgi:hypothetical protein
VVFLFYVFLFYVKTQKFVKRPNYSSNTSLPDVVVDNRKFFLKQKIVVMLYFLLLEGAQLWPKHVACIDVTNKMCCG